MRLGAVLILGFVLSGILAYFASPLLEFWAPEVMYMASSFFLGFTLVSGVGLLAEERSRGGGGLLIAFIMPMIGIFAINAVNFNPVLFGVGCVAGGVGAAYGIAQNKYDVLASTARLGYKLLAATILLQVFIATVYLINPVNPGVIQADLVQAAAPLIVAVILLVIMGYLVRRFVHGIRASNVFIFGPSKSGKTLLMLALYKEFITNFRGMKREVIIGEDEEGMRIENLLSDLDGGGLPRSTRQSDIALYVFSGKKRGFSPVFLTIIDYAGEYTADIDEKKFQEALNAISDAIELPVATVANGIGSIDFLQQLKSDYKSEVAKVLDQVVLAYIYKNLLDSGKVLFLADGDHLAEFHKGGRKEITRICGHYSRIMDLCGADKKYGLVVTKTDKFYSLNSDESAVKAAELIERDICKEWFSEIDTFQEINNRALDIPIYFYATSVFRTKQPITEYSGEVRAEPANPRYIHPWRVDGVVEFGF